MNRNVITNADADQLRDLQRTTPPPPADETGGGPPPPPPGTPTADDFWNRLMKLVPVEVIGAYLAATDLVLSVSGHTKREIALWIIFAVVLVMTPFYLKNLGKVVRRRQRAVSVAAFIVWAFALGGPFKESWGGYESWMGGVAVILFTFVLGGLRLEPLEPQQLQVATG